MYLNFTQDLINFFWESMVPFCDILPGVIGIWLLFYFIRQLLFSER